MTQLELDKSIIETYTFEVGKKPILDGIIDEERYQSGIPKILWILKETYDRGGVGGWDGRSSINDATEYYFTIKTWRRIAYSSYGIINRVTYEEAKERPEVHEILKSIAYINLSKFPAATTSNNRWKYFEDVYRKCKRLLFKQIEFYNPDIIIIGNIMYLFLEEFGLTWANQIIIPPTNKSYFIKDNKLIINAYHPSVRTNEERYCKELIKTSVQWLGSNFGTQGKLMPLI